MGVITLMTDFGIKDGNVGVMKGVIWGIAPAVHIADLSHIIGPQNIKEAALILERSAPYFPPGTVHVVVVDPGVGTARRPIAARLGKQFYVGPDNGVFTLVVERAERAEENIKFILLDRPKFWLQEISYVFHGRDIFSPVAAHLSNGVPLEEIGSHIKDIVRIQLPQPQLKPDGWQGEIIHIDHFGNISTNMRREHLAGSDQVNVRLCGAEIQGLINTFGERPVGELVALYGSTGSLIISVVNGNAAQLLKPHLGDQVEVTLIP